MFLYVHVDRKMRRILFKTHRSLRHTHAVDHYVIYIDHYLIRVDHFVIHIDHYDIHMVYSVTQKDHHIGIRDNVLDYYVLSMRNKNRPIQMLKASFIMNPYQIIIYAPIFLRVPSSFLVAG